MGAGVSQPRRNRIGALSVCVGSNSAANGGGVTRSPPRSERRSRMCVSELVGGFFLLFTGVSQHSRQPCFFNSQRGEELRLEGWFQQPINQSVNQ